jgi:hypothetical protein
MSFSDPHGAEKTVAGVVPVAKSTHPSIEGARQNNRMARVSGGWRFNP